MERISLVLVVRVLPGIGVREAQALKLAGFYNNAIMIKASPEIPYWFRETNKEWKVQDKGSTNGLCRAFEMRTIDGIDMIINTERLAKSGEKNKKPLAWHMWN